MIVFIAGRAAQAFIQSDAAGRLLGGAAEPPLPTQQQQHFGCTQVGWLCYVLQNGWLKSRKDATLFITRTVFA